MTFLYCLKCGAQIPDDSVFCMKCGTSLAVSQPSPTPVSKEEAILAPFGATALKCPKCGAPISPKFGEMVITCEYCGSGVMLGNEGWKGIQKQTMLPLKFSEKDQIIAEMHGLMDRGLLHRHLQEKSKLEEMNLSFVPYWIVSVSARTSVVASDVAVQMGEVATTAALFGIMGSAMGGRRGGGLAGPLIAGAVLGGMAGQRQALKTYEMDNNYYFPIVALKALTEYQPKNYQFRLENRTLFDVSKVPKEVKILNGDIGEETAKYQAKTLVDQLQSEKAHAQYHMIQQLHTEIDVADTELLHTPIWFAQYDHEGRKIILVIDGNTGGVINSIGL